MRNEILRLAAFVVTAGFCVFGFIWFVSRALPNPADDVAEAWIRLIATPGQTDGLGSLTHVHLLAEGEIVDLNRNGTVSSSSGSYAGTTFDIIVERVVWISSVAPDGSAVQPGDRVRVVASRNHDWAGVDPATTYLAPLKYFAEEPIHAAGVLFVDGQVFDSAANRSTQERLSDEIGNVQSPAEFEEGLIRVLESLSGA